MIMAGATMLTNSDSSDYVEAKHSVCSPLKFELSHQALSQKSNHFFLK